MLDLSGLWYRAYTVCPFLFCCGVLIISAFAFPKGKKNKDSGNTKTSIGVDQKIGCFIGALAIIFAFVCLGYYLDAIYHPRVNSIDACLLRNTVLPMVHHLRLLLIAISLSRKIVGMLIL